MVYRGVSTQLPLIKIIGIFNFTIHPFCSPSFFTASFPYIFHNSPCRKNAPLFSASHQSKIFSPAFSSVMIFHSFLMNMPIIYIEEIEIILLTLFGCILGFIEGKVDSAPNNPCYDFSL
jgi:hypothetical protein